MVQSVLPCTGNGMVCTAIPEGLADATVINLMRNGSREWDLDLLRDWFEDQDVNLICSIPISHRIIQDACYWLFDNKGVFSVKSCYRFLQGEISQQGAGLWQKIWKVKVHPKVRNCIWRVCAGCLLTLVNLSFKHVPLNTVCVQCQSE